MHKKKFKKSKERVRPTQKKYKDKKKLEEKKTKQNKKQAAVDVC